jgi:hypothetical protein
MVKWGEYDVIEIYYGLLKQLEVGGCDEDNEAYVGRMRD